MTIEEANMTIDYLKEMQEGYIEGEGYESYPLPEWYALDKAIETIEKTTWIPCSERLPEADGRYLCTYEDDIEENCVDFGSYENGEWYVDKVIAWMPLPQSYQGE